MTSHSERVVWMTKVWDLKKKKSCCHDIFTIDDRIRLIICHQNCYWKSAMQSIWFICLTCTWNEELSSKHPVEESHRRYNSNWLLALRCCWSYLTRVVEISTCRSLCLLIKKLNALQHVSSGWHNSATDWNMELWKSRTWALYNGFKIGTSWITADLQ